MQSHDVPLQEKQFQCAIQARPPAQDCGLIYSRLRAMMWWQFGSSKQSVPSAPTIIHCHLFRGYLPYYIRTVRNVIRIIYTVIHTSFKIDTRFISTRGPE